MHSSVMGMWGTVNIHRGVWRKLSTLRDVCSWSAVGAEQLGYQTAHKTQRRQGKTTTRKTMSSFYFSDGSLATPLPTLLWEEFPSPTPQIPGS